MIGRATTSNHRESSVLEVSGCEARSWEFNSPHCVPLTGTGIEDPSNPFRLRGSEIIPITLSKAQLPFRKQKGTFGNLTENIDWQNAASHLEASALTRSTKCELSLRAGGSGVAGERIIRALKKPTNPNLTNQGLGCSFAPYAHVL